uniref:Polyprotein n=1 Tax=Rhizoctonia solani endornavirus 6 TaxID=2599612 RepID=A0A5B8GB03_9VIRU|nr:polyprotein [Rhizoctonia solani endornavirus 6]
MTSTIIMGERNKCSGAAACPLLDKQTAHLRNSETKSGCFKPFTASVTINGTTELSVVSNGGITHSQFSLFTSMEQESFAFDFETDMGLVKLFSDVNWTDMGVIFIGTKMIFDWGLIMYRYQDNKQLTKKELLVRLTSDAGGKSLREATLLHMQNSLELLNASTQATKCVELPTVSKPCVAQTDSYVNNHVSVSTGKVYGLINSLPMKFRMKKKMSKRYFLYKYRAMQQVKPTPKTDDVEVEDQIGVSATTDTNVTIIDPITTVNYEILWRQPVINEHLVGTKDNCLVKHNNIIKITVEADPDDIVVGGMGDCWTRIPVFKLVIPDAEEEGAWTGTVEEHVALREMHKKKKSLPSEYAMDIDVRDYPGMEEMEDEDFEDDSDFDDEWDDSDDDESEVHFEEGDMVRFQTDDMFFDYPANEPMNAYTLIEILEWMYEEEDRHSSLYLKTPNWRFIVWNGMIHLENNMFSSSYKYTINENHPQKFTSLQGALEQLKDLVAENETTTISLKVGAPNIRGMLSRTDNEVIDALGDMYSNKYVDIVDNHDLRVVRRFYAAHQKSILLTVQPSKTVKDHFSGLTNITILTRNDLTIDADFTFCRELAMFVAYTMVDPMDFSSDDTVTKFLQTQPEAKLPSVDAKTHICTELTSNMLDSHDIVYVIAPTLLGTSYGELKLEVGNYITHGNLVEYFPKNSTLTHTITGINPILQGGRVANVNGLKVYCLATHMVGPFCIYALTTIEHINIYPEQNKTRKFEVPIFDSWLFSEVGVDNLKFEMTEVNQELLNRLLNRNITNTVSDEKMVEYIMALSWYSYNKRGVEIANVKVTPEMAKTHLYLAKGLLMREELSEQLTQAALTKGSISRIAIATLSAMLRVKSFTLGETTTNIIQWVESLFNTTQVLDSANKAVQFWDTLDIWRSSSTELVHGNPSITGCSHHASCELTETGHACLHCGFETADKQTLYCECCYDTEHDCKHDCDVVHVGRNVCKCCKKNTENEPSVTTKTVYCDCCLLKHTETVSEEQSKRESDEPKTRPSKPVRHEESGPGEHKESMAKPAVQPGISKPYKKGHTHTCEKCRASFACECSNALENDVRQRPKDSCPMCEGNKTNKLLYSTILQTGETVFQPLTTQQYLTRLTPNAVVTLTNPELALETHNVDFTTRRTSGIPFLTKDMYSNSEFEFTNIKTAGPADCGFEAVQHYLTTMVTETHIFNSIKKIENFTADDIKKLFRENRMNLLLVTSTTEVVRCKQNDEFAVIMHAMANGENINHWYVADAKHASKVVPYGSIHNTRSEHEKQAKRIFSKSYSELTREQQLNLSYHLASATEIVFKGSLPFVKLVGDTMSNCDQPTRYGDIKVKVHNKLIDLVELMLQAKKTGKIDDRLSEPLITDSTTPIEEKLLGEARAALYDIAIMWTKPQQNCRVKIVSTTFYGGTNCMYLPGIKRGDMISYNYKGVITSNIVEPTREGMVAVDRQTANDVTVYLPKASLSSLLMKFATINKALVGDNHDKNANARFIHYSGPGGAGKTTAVVEKMVEAVNDDPETKIVATAMSREATDTLRTRLFAVIPQYNLTVETFERISSFDNLKCDYLIIDEATMIHDWQFHAMPVTAKNVILIGDTGQIGAEDFSLIPGRRPVISVMDRYEDIGERVESWEVKRYGNPLAEELSRHPALRKLQGNKDMKTAVNLYWNTNLVGSQILEAFAHCDVVIVFYNDHVDLIKKALSNSNIVVTTAAKYQSKEADHVGVLQSPIIRNQVPQDGDMHLNFQYTYSAATRARKSLSWLSVACHNTGVPLATRLGIRVGSFYNLLGKTTISDVKWDWNMQYETVEQEEVDLPPMLPDRQKVVEKLVGAITLVHNGIETVTMNAHDRICRALGLDISGKTLPNAATIARIKANSTQPPRIFFALDNSPWITPDPYTGARDWMDHIGVVYEYEYHGVYVKLFYNYNYYGYSCKIWTVENPTIVPEYCMIDSALDPLLLANRIRHYETTGKYMSNPPISTVSCWAIVTDVFELGGTTRSLTYCQRTKAIVPYTLRYIYPKNNETLERYSNNLKLNATKICNMYNTNAVSYSDISRQVVRACALACGFKEMSQSSEGTTYEVQAKHPKFAQVGVRVVNNVMQVNNPNAPICQMLALCVMNSNYVLKIMGNIHKPRMPVISNTNLQLERARALAALNDLTLPVDAVDDISRLDYQAFVTDFLEVGRERNSTLNIEMTKAGENYSFKMSATVGFITGSRTVVMKPDLTVFSTELGRTRTAQFRRSLHAYSYGPPGSFETGNIKMKLSKFATNRIRVLAYIVKVFHANNEEFQPRVGTYWLDIKTSYTGCAACTALYFTLDGHKTTVTADYDFRPRYVFGPHADIIKELLEEPGKCRLYPPEFEDKNFGLAILTERVYGWWKQMFTKLSYMQYMRDNKYNNIITINRIRETLGKNVANVEYDDMTNYPFWNQRCTQLSVIIDGKREIIDNPGLHTRQHFTKMDYILESLANLNKAQHGNKISRIISMVYVSNIGALERIAGMQESIAWHKANKTATANTLASKSTKQLVKALKYEEEVHPVPHKVYEYAKEKYGYQSLMSNNAETIADYAQQATDVVMCAGLVGRNSMKVAYYGNCPYITLLMPSVSMVEKYNQNYDILQTKLQIPTMLKMCETFLSHLPADDERYSFVSNLKTKYSVKISDADVAYCSPAILKGSNYEILDRLKELMANHSKVYIFLGRKVDENADNCYYRVDESNNILATGKWIEHCIHNGNNIMPGFKLHIANMLPTGNLLTISSNNWVDKPMIGKSFQIVKLPLLFTNPSKIINKSTLFDFVEYAVDVAFYNNMERRAINNATLKDLKVQARTMVNVGQFTTANVASKYKVNVATAAQTALFAYIAAQNLNRKYALTGMLDQERPVSSLFKLAGLKAITDMLGDSGDQLNYDNLLELMTNYLPINDVYNVIIQTVENLKALSINPKANYRCIKTTQGQVTVPKMKPTSDKYDCNNVVTYDQKCSTCVDRPELTDTIKSIGLEYMDDPRAVLVKSARCEHKGIAIVDSDNKDALTHKEQLFVAHPTLDLAGHAFAHITANKAGYYDENFEWAELRAQNIHLPYYESCVYNECRLDFTALDTLNVRVGTIIYNSSDCIITISLKAYQNNGEYIRFGNNNVVMVADPSGEEKIIRTGRRSNQSNIKVSLVTNVSQKISFFSMSDMCYIMEDAEEVVRGVAQQCHHTWNELQSVEFTKLSSGEYKSRYNNTFWKLLVGHNRWGVNINPLHGNMHLLSNTVKEPGALNIDELKFIHQLQHTLQVGLDNLLVDHSGRRIKSFQNKFVHIYALDKNIDRTVMHATDDTDVTLIICNDGYQAKKTPVHVNLIRVPADAVGRYNAAMRLIVGLLAKAAYTQFHEGQPHIVSYFYEMFAYKLAKKTKSGVSLSWARNFGCPIGHTVWRGMPTGENWYKIMRTSVAYGGKYGSDEIHYAIWPVDTWYVSPYSYLKSYSIGSIIDAGRNLTKVAIPDNLTAYGITYEEYSKFDNKYGMEAMPTMYRNFDKRWNSKQGGRLVDTTTPPLNYFRNTISAGSERFFCDSDITINCNDIDMDESSTVSIYFTDENGTSDSGSDGSSEPEDSNSETEYESVVESDNDGASDRIVSDKAPSLVDSDAEVETIVASDGYETMSEGKGRTSKGVVSNDNAIAKATEHKLLTGEGKYCGIDACPAELRKELNATIISQNTAQQVYEGWFDDEQLKRAFSTMGYDYASIKKNREDARPTTAAEVLRGNRPTVIYHNDAGVHWYDGYILTALTIKEQTANRIASKLELTVAEVTEQVKIQDDGTVETLQLPNGSEYTYEWNTTTKHVIDMTRQTLAYMETINPLSDEMSEYLSTLIGRKVSFVTPTKNNVNESNTFKDYMVHIVAEGSSPIRDQVKRNVGLEFAPLLLENQLHTVVQYETLTGDPKNPQRHPLNEIVQSEKYNPETDGQCTQMCIEYCYMFMSAEADESVLGGISYNMGDWATTDRTVKTAYLINMNCIIMDSGLKEAHIHIINEGPIAILGYKYYEGSKNGHCIVHSIVQDHADLNLGRFTTTRHGYTFAPQTLKFRLDEMTPGKMVDYLTETERDIKRGDIPELNDWHMRWTGRMDIVANKKKNAVATEYQKCGDLMCVNLRPEGGYVYRTGNSSSTAKNKGMELMVTCTGEDGKTYALSKHCTEYVLDVNMLPTFTPRRQQAVIKQENGLLNIESKQIALRNYNEYGALPVNREAKNLVILQYDGVSHHFRADREAILAAMTDDKRQIIIPVIKNAAAFEWIVQSGGPFVPIVMGRDASLGWGGVQDFIKSCLQICIDTISDVNTNYYNAAAVNKVIQWQLLGNRWGPTKKQMMVNEKGKLEERDLSQTKDKDYENELVTSVWKITQTLLNKYEVADKDNEDDKVTIRYKKMLQDWKYQMNVSVKVIKQSDDLQPARFSFDKRDKDLMRKTGILLDLTNSYIIDLHSNTVFRYTNIGRGTFEEAVKEVILENDVINTTNELYKGQFDKTFGKVLPVIAEKAYEFTDDQKQTAMTIDVLNDSYVTDWKVYPEIISNNHGGNDIYTGNGQFDCPINVEILEHDRSPKIINFYEDNTAMVDNSIELPNQDIGLRGGELMTGLTVAKKGLAVEYPTHAQPNYIQRAGAGVAAISKLYSNKVSLRQVQHDPKGDADDFISVYAQEGSITAIPQVNIDAAATLEWLKERPGTSKVVADFIEVIENGLDIVGMDKVNVHTKLESRLKDVMMEAIDEIGMPEIIDEQRIRLIVWQRKGITAVFAPFFQQLKENLKRCLKHNIVYADGLTPMQISELVKKLDINDARFVEDDLEKQDRQTDMTLIKTEMEVYKRLGGNPGVIDMWETVHHNWRAKGLGYKFDGDACRHTGQATTALGNAIVNLLVKKRIVREMGNNLLLMLVLGDDNLIITKYPLTAQQVSQQSARHFNMASKAEVSMVQGTFLRMICYKDEKLGNFGLGPDIVRLRRKYEVLNGVSEINDQNIIMRAISYCCMIGLTPETHAFTQKSGFNVKLHSWYSWSALRHATATKYKTTEAMIDNEYSLLMKTLVENKIFINEQLMFTSKMS